MSGTEKPGIHDDLCASRRVVPAQCNCPSAVFRNRPRKSSWEVEQRPAELVFRRDINERRVVVYYRETDHCRWYVFCPAGEDFESQGTAAGLTTALTAAEAAAEGGR